MMKGITIKKFSMPDNGVSIFIRTSEENGEIIVEFYKNGNFLFLLKDESINTICEHIEKLKKL